MRFSRMLSLLSFLTAFPVLVYGAPVGVSPTVGSSLSPSQIGIVAAVRGAVKVGAPGKVGRVVGSGEPIYLADEISTDEKGNLQILLLDQTIFTIGPNSTIVIDKFIYDPASHDGEVKARVVKGVFRFVTGKIGQKKPQQMEVDLPAGTIGIRGTIVAGEVVGQKSTIILLGPGENNNTSHRQGSFSLSNEAGGSLQQETVNKAGFASTIAGEGIGPTKPFQVPAEDLARITTTLGSSSAAPDASDPQAAAGDQTGDGEAGESPTEQSGQGTAAAGPSIQRSDRVARVVQNLGLESGQAAQRLISSGIFQILNGPTSRDQLQLAAQRISGIHHFEIIGIGLTPGDGQGQAGSASFFIDIDFGARRIGGGYSKVTGTLTTGSFEFLLSNPKPFGAGPENASFSYPNVARQSGTCADCGVADIDIGINNQGGEIASHAQVGIKIKPTAISVIPESLGGGIASRVEGATS